jgi:hypothetical protein
MAVVVPMRMVALVILAVTELVAVVQEIVTLVITVWQTAAFQKA